MKAASTIVRLVVSTLTNIISYLESILIGSTYNLAFASPNDGNSDDDVPDLIPDNDDDDDPDDDDDDVPELEPDNPQPQGNTTTTLGQVIDQNPRNMSVRELRESLEEIQEWIEDLDHPDDREIRQGWERRAEDLQRELNNRTQEDDDDDDDSNNNPEGGNSCSGGGGPGNTSNPSGGNSNSSVIDNFLVGFLGILSYIGDTINSLPIGF